MRENLNKIKLNISDFPVFVFQGRTCPCCNFNPGSFEKDFAVESLIRLRIHFYDVHHVRITVKDDITKPKLPENLPVFSGEIFWSDVQILRSHLVKILMVRYRGKVDEEILTDSVIQSVLRWDASKSASISTYSIFSYQKLYSEVHFPRKGHAGYRFRECTILSLDQLISKQNEKKYEILVSPEENDYDQPNPNIELFRKCIRKLPDNLRQVLDLYCELGSQEKVAKVLSISPAYVSILIRGSRKKLKEFMSEQEQGNQENNTITQNSLPSPTKTESILQEKAVDREFLALGEIVKIFESFSDQTVRLRMLQWLSSKVPTIISSPDNCLEKEEGSKSSKKSTIVKSTNIVKDKPLKVDLQSMVDCYNSPQENGYLYSVEDLVLQAIKESGGTGTTDSISKILQSKKMGSTSQNFPAMICSTLSIMTQKNKLVRIKRGCYSLPVDKIDKNPDDIPFFD